MLPRELWQRLEIFIVVVVARSGRRDFFQSWSSGQDSMFPMQGAWVQSLVRELLVDPTYRNEEFEYHN